MTNRTGRHYEELLASLEALSNPQRLRIVAALHGGATYVSQLARELSMSRPLLHVHLQKLERAGLVSSHSEVAEDGKARRYYAVTAFEIMLNSEIISNLANEETSKIPSKGGSHG